MVDNFETKEIKLQTYETLNHKTKTIPRHIVKLLKTNVKEEILPLFNFFYLFSLTVDIKYF